MNLDDLVVISTKAKEGAVFLASCRKTAVIGVNTHLHLLESCTVIGANITLHLHVRCAVMGPNTPSLVMQVGC